MLRAVVDTNVWVSAVLNRGGAPARVREALSSGRFTLIASEPLLEEIADVLSRPRITRKYGITRSDITELIALLRHLAEMVPVTGDLQICRDPDDDVVIETALRGRADLLVTRDDDLKDASEVAEALAAGGVAIATVRRFLFLLDENPPLPQQSVEP